MQISVLILTHNRPELFKRCIESVLEAREYFPLDIEILVNNDSDDVEESDDYTLFRKKSDNLGEIYKFLFEKASKEYVYFLEDDDFMMINFFKILSFMNSDIMYGNYIPAQWNNDFINFSKFKSFTNKDEFLKDYDDHNFQFSQIVFKKNLLSLKDFPTDNYLQNDFKIFKLLKGTFQNTSEIFYKQTRDGHDAISSKYNKDPRWIT